MDIKLRMFKCNNCQTPSKPEMIACLLSTQSDFMDPEKCPHNDFEAKWENVEE